MFAKIRVIIVILGFISGSVMLPAYGSTFDRIEVKTEATLNDFQKVYIAPVKVELARTPQRLTRFRAVNRADLPIAERAQIQKAADVHSQLVRTFSQHFEIVSAQIDDALTIQTTITRLAPSRPTLELTRTVPGLDISRSTFAGGGTFSVTLSADSAELLTITEEYQSRLTDRQPRITTWQDFDRASKRFSKDLARYIRKN